MVADQYGLADGEPVPNPARGIGEQHGLRARGNGGAHIVHNLRGRITLVQVLASHEQQHRRVIDEYGVDGALVPLGGGRSEARNLAHGDGGGGLTDFGGGFLPSGSEHHRDPVTLHSRTFGYRLRGGLFG